jgi:hypothetical protein
VTAAPATEFPFVLPRGVCDEHGDWHREGLMRLATARDELMPLRDPRVHANEAYLNVLLLARVVVRLGSLPHITPAVIESLFASDLSFLQDLYRRVNQQGHARLDVTCPDCRSEFTVELTGDALGEAG